ncbi:MAG: sulfatase-like hydrolase/transferase [Polaribacter sp.]
MKTIQAIKILIITVLLSSSCFAQKKKNLLFIITDQQRYDALSVAGNTVLETPNLDRLAKSGAYFKNAYTPVAVCGPARSCILTGTTINTNGVNTNKKTYNYKEKPVMTMSTFDEILTDNGYTAEYYGKWHTLSSHAKVYKNPKKFSKKGKSMFGPGGQSHMYQDYLKEAFPFKKLKKGEHFDKTSKRGYIPNPLDANYGKDYQKLDAKSKKLVQPDLHGQSIIPAEHSYTAYHAKVTMEAIERLKDQPFSITCSFHFPHAPMLPSVPYYEMYPSKDMVPPVSINDDMVNSPYANANGRKKLTRFADAEKIKYMISEYYGLIKEIDDWMGKILDKLDEVGVADNTLIIFTSDHGEMLGAHGMREKNVFYEESSHVPLMISMPNEIPKNTQVDGYVSNVDLFATIMDYLKVGNYPSEGKSLRDLIEGKETTHGDYVVTEWNYRGDVAPNYMIMKDGWKLMVPYSATSKVINALYDLNTDPHEMNNLLGKNPNKSKYADKAEELRQNLLGWLKHKKSIHYDGVKNRKLI